MCDKDIEEITQLISELTLMKKEIKHNTSVNSNKILKMYEGYIGYTEIDSGIESETIEQSFDNFILPADNLQEIVFASNDFDEVLKNLFKYVWQCLHQSMKDIEENENKIQRILECIKDFVGFLSVSKNDFFREIIVKKNLDALLLRAMETQNEDLFHFVMEILVTLGSVKELYSCIFNLIIEKVKTFADKVNTANPDGMFLLKYATDVSRINTLMITAQCLKQETQNEFKIETENIYDICYILETFAKYSDFYMLEFTAQKLFRLD